MTGYIWTATDPLGVEYQLNDNTNSFYLWDVGRRYWEMTPIGSRRPYTDGVTYRGNYTATRTVRVAFGIKGTSQAGLEAALRGRYAFLSHKKVTDSGLFKLTVRTLDGNLRQLSGLFLTPAETWGGAAYCEVVHTFLAFDPWWIDPEEKDESLVAPAATGFSFPLSWDASFAATEIAGRVYITNTGDLETWPIIIVPGPLDNPTVRNETTEKELKLTVSTDVNDTLTIDMAAGTILHYDQSEDEIVSVLAGLSTDSEFWSLVKGNNTIYLEAEGATGGTITVRYYLRYLSA